MPNQNIPKGWKKVKLGDVVEVINGGTPSTKINEYWNGDIVWITPKDMSIQKENKYIFQGEKSITELGLKKSSAKLVPKNSIIISSRAPVGYVMISKTELSTNQGCKSLVIKNNNVDIHFLYYLLKISKDNLEQISGGATFKELRTLSLKNLSILLPPLPIQKKVASILSKYDDLIENNNKRIKILEDMGKAIFDDMMKQAKEKGELEEMKLTDVCKIKYGKNLPKSKLISDGKYPVYGASKIIGYYNEYNVENRTLIVGCRGTVGEVNITNPKSFVTNNSFIIECNKYKKWYLYFYFRKRGFNDIIGGVAQPQITLSGMETIKVDIVSDNILLGFYNIANPLFEEIYTLQLQNQNLKQARDLLIPRLVSGKLDVENVEVM